MMYSVYMLNKQGDSIQPWCALFPIWNRSALTYSFPSVEPDCCSISGLNCCFSTSIQISQEAGKFIWYLHLLKNFPQFVVIHTAKGFSRVNEAEVDVFLELPCFFYDATDVGNLISGSSALSKYSLYIWEFFVHIPLRPSLKDFEHYLLACEMSAIVQQSEHSLTLPFFGIGMKTELIQSCGHCWVYQICWHIVCSDASS